MVGARLVKIGPSNTFVIGAGVPFPKTFYHFLPSQIEYDMYINNKEVVNATWPQFDFELQHLLVHTWDDFFAFIPLYMIQYNIKSSQVPGGLWRAPKPTVLSRVK